MKHLISRRNFLKAAGVTTAAAAMAVGAPAASACWTGEKSEVTILYPPFIPAKGAAQRTESESVPSSTSAEPE